MVRVRDYWPEVADDLTRVSWSHATNSKALLDQALADSTMMIEADVSLGPGNRPIMAHPPANTSDLSLQQFLETVLESTEAGAKKGIKLDFKLLGVVEPSLSMLEGLRDRLAIPLWLNADILQGPGGGEQIGFRFTFMTFMLSEASEDQKCLHILKKPLNFLAIFLTIFSHRHTDIATHKLTNQ